MLTASAQAVHHIDAILKNNPEKILTVSVQSGGCSGFQYNWQLKEKDNFENIDDYEKVQLAPDIDLWVDTLSEAYLSGTHLEYETSLQKSELVFKNPNAKARCGCGKSFGV